MIQSIQSSTNSKFQLWKSLLKSKGIREHGLFILSGEKVIQEYLSQPNLKTVSEIITNKMMSLQNDVTTFELSVDLFKELDVIGTNYPLLIVEMPDISFVDQYTIPKGLEIVIPVGDPSNLGALIRSAVAFGVSKIYLTEESAHPFHPKAVKASSGSVMKAPLFFTGPLFEADLPSTWALDSTGKNLMDIQLPKDLRILVGEEGPGLGNLRNVQRVCLPIQNVESLNATVAASLLMWEYRRQS